MEVSVWDGRLIAAPPTHRPRVLSVVAITLWIENTHTHTHTHAHTHRFIRSRETDREERGRRQRERKDWISWKGIGILTNKQTRQKMRFRECVCMCWEWSVLLSYNCRIAAQWPNIWQRKHRIILQRKKGKNKQMWVIKARQYIPPTSHQSLIFWNCRFLFVISLH